MSTVKQTEAEFTMVDNSKSTATAADGLLTAPLTSKKEWVISIQSEVLLFYVSFIAAAADLQDCMQIIKYS
jgi:hypothetical protein